MGWGKQPWRLLFWTLYVTLRRYVHLYVGTPYMQAVPCKVSGGYSPNRVHLGSELVLVYGVLRLGFRLMPHKAGMDSFSVSCQVSL